ncbi:SAM-dependent methyltransferase [Actinoallomurus acanthiterrae]
MTSDNFTAAAERIDTSRPHSARVWDYWLGGKDNYEADRALGDQIAQTFPHVVTTTRADREFMHRSVAFLTETAGIRQFLDIGTGLPTAPNTHQVAQRIAPDTRVVYVDNDPVVLAHARALLASSSEGACAYLDADLREPGRILSEAADTLDFTRPVAITLMSLLHFINDYSDARFIVSRLLEAVPSGSYLALTHATDEIGGPAVKKAYEMWNANAVQRARPRTNAEVTALFDGLDIVEPGIVSPPSWRPPEDAAGPWKVPLWAGVARKP